MADAADSASSSAASASTGLCPYPSYGVQPYRSELGEAFCQGEQTLLNRGLSASWQMVPRANLKRFWAQMADRVRGASTDHD